MKIKGRSRIKNAITYGLEANGDDSEFYYMIFQELFNKHEFIELSGESHACWMIDSKAYEKIIKKLYTAKNSFIEGMSEKRWNDIKNTIIIWYLEADKSDGYVHIDWF